MKVLSPGKNDVLFKKNRLAITITCFLGRERLYKW